LSSSSFGIKVEIVVLFENGPEGKPMLTYEDEEKISELVKRAAGDKKLQKGLLDDPSEFLRSNGIAIPQGLEATIATDKESLTLRLQPQRPAGDNAELTEGALNNVVGGLTFMFKLVAVKTISWS
jgi:hypothetical protein